jgi:hypothetical protein
MKTLQSVLVVLGVVVAHVPQAFAVAVSSGEIVNGTSATFTPPSSLIEGITASYIGGNSPIAVPPFAGWAQMNDGVVGAANLNSQTLLLDHATSSFAPAYAVWVLDTSVNAQGYDIFSIQSFAGYNSNRPWQNIEIKYALVGDNITGPLTRTLGSFSYTPTIAQLSDYHATKLSVFDNFDDPLLTNVIAIQVSYLDNGFNPSAGNSNATSYKEFSVVGVASVPEPSTVILFGLAAVGLLVRWRTRA